MRRFYWVLCSDFKGEWRTCHTAVQSRKAVSAYFTSKQILSFDFARAA